MTTIEVPEIWFKAKRVIRTVIAVVVSIAVSFASTIAAVQVFAPDALEQLGRVLPPDAVAWLTGALALMVVIAGVITRIMAIPGVNALLTKIGAGSVPASYAEDRTPK